MNGRHVNCVPLVVESFFMVGVDLPLHHLESFLEQRQELGVDPVFRLHGELWVKLGLPECLPCAFQLGTARQKQFFGKLRYLAKQPIDDCVNAVLLNRLLLRCKLVKQDTRKEKQHSVREVVLARCLEDKIDEGFHV